MRAGDKLSTPLFQLPKALPVSALPIGIFLLFLQILNQFFRRISDWRSIARSEVADFHPSRPYALLALFCCAWFLGIWLIITGNRTAGMLILLFSLLFSGQPIAWSLGLAGCSLLYFGFGGATQLIQISRIAYSSMDHFILVAVPLFIFAGSLLEKGGVAEELYQAATAMVGHLPGGTGIATVVACAIFAACSGSSVATAAAVGAIALDSMKQRRYNTRMTYGTIAAGGTLGILIPPSNPLIIYGAMTDESVGASFIAGIIPGIMITLLFSFWIIVQCKRTGQYEKIDPYTWIQRLQTLRKASWGLIVPILIMGTIFLGIATPTESAAIAVTYALIMLFFRKRISLRLIFESTSRAAHTSTMVFMIIVGALILGQGTTFIRLPYKLSSWVVSSNIDPWLVILMIMVGFVILGTFLEIISIMMITLPVVYPLVVETLGFNGIWFAILMVVNMEMSLITPPVGLNLFVIQGLSGDRLIEVIRGIVPFFLLMAASLIAIAFFPQLALWLPKLMF
jgi:C4-dicarboxylate transporter DctM subunit